MDAVVDLLHDEERWRAFSAAGRARVLEHHAWDRIAGQWLDLFAAAYA